MKDASLAARNKQLIQDLYARVFSGGDRTRALELFTDDVVFHLPGRNRFAGDWTKATWGRLVAEIMELTGGTYAGTLQTALADESCGVALVNYVAQRGESRLEWSRVNVYRFVDGQIAEVWEQQADQYGVDALLA